MPPFSPGERVIVLGAGATRGSCFQDFHPECQPPLNKDFFTQLQRIRSKHQKVVHEVIKDIISLFGSNFSLTLEDYFTQLEFLSEAVKLASRGASSSLTSEELLLMSDRLRAALAAALEMSTDVAIRKSGGCQRHRSLIQGLEARDTVISFNYDCVIDHALRQHGGDKWSARHGYTFPEPSRLTGYEYWNPSEPVTSQMKTIYLLKLHGSLHWQLPSDRDGEIKFKRRLHSQHGIPRFSIIPPIWNKGTVSAPLFQVLWRNAERAIRGAKHVAIVGFSFTPTDLHAESLFRVALSKSKLKTLVIANPSQMDRRRIREVFSRPLERGTLVRQFEDFQHFVEEFPSCMN